MLVKDVETARPFVAGDGSLLREILHPARDRADLGCSLAQATVKPGESTLPHRLSHVEVYCVLAGTGAVHVGDEVARVRAGHAVLIPPGAVQWIENSGADDLVFLCLVSPPWTPECEEVLT